MCCSRRDRAFAVLGFLERFCTLQLRQQRRRGCSHTALPKQQQQSSATCDQRAVLTPSLPFLQNRRLAPESLKILKEPFCANVSSSYMSFKEYYKSTELHKIHLNTGRCHHVSLNCAFSMISGLSLLRVSSLPPKQQNSLQFSNKLLFRHLAKYHDSLVVS